MTRAGIAFVALCGAACARAAPVADDRASPPVEAVDPLPPCRRELPVGSDADLAAALAGAGAGDCVLAAPGRYRGLTLTAQARAEAPLVLRAAVRGAAVFEGRVTLRKARAVVIEGFAFTGSAGVTISDGDGNRVTRNRFATGPGTVVSINGHSRSNRVDHNDFGPLLRGHFIHPTGSSERTRIDHNYLHDLSDCHGNGCESISLGCCGPVADAHETFNVVEHNLLERCDGESELIGMKSSRNLIRFNTIRQSRGQISFRAGRRNVVHGNYILGAGKPGAQGLRVLDEDHEIYDNYVEVSDFPLRVQHGEVPAFPPVRRARITHNTFVVAGAPIELGGTHHAIAPAESHFEGNLLVGTGGGPLLLEKDGGITWKGNLAVGRVDGKKRPDELRVLGELGAVVTRVGEVLRPAPGGPVVGAHALGSSAGQGPLLPQDVGPEAP